MCWGSRTVLCPGGNDLTNSALLKGEPEEKGPGAQGAKSQSKTPACALPYKCHRQLDLGEESKSRFPRIIQERQLEELPRSRFGLRRNASKLTRIMHALSVAEPGSSALTALPTLGLLNRVHDYASAALGRNALSARRFRLFASTTRELSGLKRCSAKIFRSPKRQRGSDSHNQVSS